MLWLKQVILGLMLALLLPASALAFSVQSVGSSVTASTNKNLYRLRAATKPWQLSALPADSLAAQPVVFNGKLLVVATTAESAQVFISDGLNYQPVNGLAAEQINLIDRGDYVAVGLRTGSAVSAAVITGGLSAIVLPDLNLTNLDQVNNIFSANGEIYYGEALNGFVRILHRTSSGWEAMASFTCIAGQLTTHPLLGFQCQEGRFYFPLTLSSWQPLFPVTVEHITTSQTILAASDALSNLYIWRNNQLQSYSLTLAGRTIEALNIGGDRLFIRLSDGSWYEFDLASFNLTAPPGPADTIIAAAHSSRLFLLAGSTYYFSDAAGNWQPLVTSGDFSEASKVTGGWLAWQAGGSVVQFAAEESAVFTKVTSSWAASSQIQAVLAEPAAGYVLLLNSSNNPNLYQSADFQNWSRLTLPNNPTYVLSIAATRDLPAGSLAEVTGVISVPVGAVSGEALYLQDDTGGVQVFLDSSKGALPTQINKLAIATGTISSSQTKRLTLSALDDLRLGEDRALTPVNVEPTALVNHLGQAVTTQTTISAKGGGYFSLLAGSSTLKFHFPADLLNFDVGSVVKLPLVVDYNSSSGAIETWYLGSGAQLIASPIASTAAVTKAVVPAVTTAAVATPTAKKVVSANSPAVLVPVPLAVPPASSPILTANDPTLVSGAQENDFTQTLTLAIASFITGALAMRGRRLKQLVRFS